MAVDLSIQVFSYELFNTILVEHKLTSSDPLPKANYDGIYCGYKGDIHPNIDIVRAVYCRQALFHDVYRLQFEYADIVSYDSPCDFIAYMCSTFSSREFKELSVFEHIFATCAFVVEMCIDCFYKGNTYFLDHSFLCWAMYFDTELKCDFYKQGGWNVLKSVAISYRLPFYVVKTCLDYEEQRIVLLHTVPMQKLITGIENFYEFHTFGDVEENPTRAKMWVNFRLNEKAPQNRTSNKEFDTKTIEGLELFLMCFKFACDPLGETVFPVNKDLADITKKLSDCDIYSPIDSFADFSEKSDSFADFSEKIDSFSEPIDRPKAIWSFKGALHAVTLEIQAMKSDTPVGDQKQEGNYRDNKNEGILRIYDLIKVSLDVDDVQTALSHAPVFWSDTYSHKRGIIAKMALKKILEVKNNQQSDHNKKCQLPTLIDSLKFSDGTKGNKKEKRYNTRHENVPVIHSTNNSSSVSEVYSDDTKYFLRKVLVLGCPLGYNYRRSTLRKPTETISF